MDKLCVCLTEKEWTQILNAVVEPYRFCPTHIVKAVYTQLENREVKS